MPKMTVTTNDGRFVADFEIGDVDPVDYQPEIDEVLREAFESEGAPVPDWLQRDDGQDNVGPGSSLPQRSREEKDRPWESAAGPV
jgi:hypothetical protein